MVLGGDFGERFGAASRVGVSLVSGMIWGEGVVGWVLFLDPGLEAVVFGVRGGCC